MEVYVWELGEQYVSIPQIKEEWSVGAFSAKWLNEAPSKMLYVDNSRNKDPRDDKALLKRMWELLDKADRVVTQNGEKFDAKKLNARFIQMSMNPPSPYEHIDTYKLTKKVADFTSHKLEYLTDKLNVKYKKLAHEDFPGMSLWKACLRGDKDAWASMKKYNMHDVLSTEEMYLNIRAWAPETMAKPFRITDAGKECGTCGVVGQMREGEPRHSKGRTYRQHSCLKCGAWQKAEAVR